MLGQEGHDHGIVFAALRFVDGDGVGQGDVIELVPLVDDRTSIILDDQPEVDPVDMDDVADVAVEDVLLVVVADLHDLVPDPEFAQAHTQALAAPVEPLLQLGIQALDPDEALVHGADHLNLGRKRREMELLGDAPADRLENGGEDLGLLLGPDEVEIRILVALGRIDELLALVDPVGILDDEAAGFLAEDFAQADDRLGPGLDEVAQELARPEGGQLVLVADQDEPHGRGHGLDQRVHQGQIDHGELVDDDGLALQRPVLVSPERAQLGIELQRPVQGLGFLAGGLGQALGRPAGGRRQQDRPAPFVEDRGHGLDDGRFAGARAARDDHDLLAEALHDGPLLVR